MNTVLLVEDERALADTLLLSLEKLKYECTWAKNLCEARKQLSQHQFDFWILDRNLPDGDGVSLLAENPARTAHVLILSAKAEVSERVKGLKAGADDYLSKPFSFAELNARLEALSRRSAPADNADSNSLWSLQNDTLEVVAPTGKIRLTPLEFKFLTYLIEREGTIVSKDRLLKDVWGFTFLPKTRTVDYVITQLRKRLELEPENPAHLLTIRGAGLKFSR
ncbi:MAG: response regulator transcription factor [Bdellovibrionales bacterium]|nr:response regulator transcription factor [Bdellovibrionales bacterium]